MAGKRPERKIYFILALIFMLTMGIVVFIVQYQTNNIVDELLLNQVHTAATMNRQREMNWWIVLASVFCIAVSAVIILVSGTAARKCGIFSDRHLDQQILMASISRSFLSNMNTDALITSTLRMVGEFMDIPQVLLFLMEDDNCTLTCRNEWINTKLGLASRIGGTMILKEPMLSIIQTLQPGKGKDSCLHSNDPVIKAAMSPYRVNFKNYISTPFFVKGEMIGVIDFSRESDGRNWSDSDISLATLFASTLSGVFERETMGWQTAIVDNSPHMIFYTDSSSNLMYANPAAAAVTGYSLDELKAGGFGLLVDAETLRKIKTQYVPATLKNGLDREEVIVVCKDGRMRILEVTSFIVQDEMVAAIGVDLTEERTLESELIKAKEKADEASRAKSEFLSNMSHEMRTPMNAIIGMTAIAKNTADIGRKNYALDKVEEASTHLLGIINDILDMMKIEANKLELTNVAFNLRVILQKSVSFVHFSIEEKRIRFRMKIDDNVPFYCVGDDQRLTQIVINLLSNAVKFTPENGEISLNVSLLGEAEGKCELHFEVVDSGIGISPEQQEKLFHMFEQGESGITRKFGGTGLGLAISKRIVELMEGRITVESELYKGSRFIFTVKLMRDTNEVHPLPGLDGEGREESTQDMNIKFTGKKLLLAEDIEINREILISLLEDTGVLIDTAENGKEAYEKIAAAPDNYNLVFMDMQMPEMDGLEATRRVRELEEQRISDTGASLKRLPIIAMTANVFKDDIDNCLAVGMDDHIGKPLDLNTVLEKLCKYL